MNHAVYIDERIHETSRDRRRPVHFVRLQCESSIMDNNLWK